MDVRSVAENKYKARANLMLVIHTGGQTAKRFEDLVAQESRPRLLQDQFYSVIKAHRNVRSFDAKSGALRSLASIRHRWHLTHPTRGELCICNPRGDITKRPQYSNCSQFAMNLIITYPVKALDVGPSTFCRYCPHLQV